MNAANEIAVEAFLEGGIPFTGIGETIDAVLAGIRPRRMESLDEIIDEDGRVRARTRRLIAQRT